MAATISQLWSSLFPKKEYQVVMKGLVCQTKFVSRDGLRLDATADDHDLFDQWYSGKTTILYKQLKVSSRQAIYMVEC